MCGCIPVWFCFGLAFLSLTSPLLHGLVLVSYNTESLLGYSSVKHRDCEKVTDDEVGHILSVRGKNCQSLILDVYTKASHNRGRREKLPINYTCFPCPLQERKNDAGAKD